TGSLTFTTTVWVVDRVHDNTADGRALTLPPVTSGLAPADVGLLRVTNLTDGGAAASVNVADLARGHPQLCVAAFLSNELYACTRGASDLGTATRLQLDRVNDRTEGDVA